MKKHLRAFTLVILVGLPLVVGCNIYAPIAGSGDPLEAAISCLHDGDFACAIEAYNRLPDGELKQQKLCTVQMAQAGFSLTALIDIFNDADAQGAQVMGVFAGALLPNLKARGADVVVGAAEAAVNACSAYNTTVSTGTPQEQNFGVLLNSLSLFLDCAVRIAKADVLVTTANGSADCTTAGNNDGVLDAADIGPGDGIPTVANPGMCGADVLKCAQDIEALDGAALSNSDLEGLSTALGNVPADLKNSAAGEQAIRTAIRQTTSAR